MNVSPSGWIYGVNFITNIDKKRLDFTNRSNPSRYFEFFLAPCFWIFWKARMPYLPMQKYIKSPVISPIHHRSSTMGKLKTHSEARNDAINVTIGHSIIMSHSIKTYPPDWSFCMVSGLRWVVRSIVLREWAFVISWISPRTISRYTRIRLRCNLRISRG